MSIQFYLKQFSLASEHSLVLFDPSIGPYQILSLRARVDLGVMVVSGYSTFPKAAAQLEPNHQIVSCHFPDTRWREVSHPSAEKQSVYSTDLGDSATRCGGLTSL